MSCLDLFRCTSSSLPLSLSVSRLPGDQTISCLEKVFMVDGRVHEKLNELR